MSRNKKIIIAVVALVAIALGRRIRVVDTPLDGANRHGRNDPHARSRSHRVGVGQDSAEAARQHQRRHVGPRRRPRGQRRRPRRRWVSSCCRSIRESLRTRVDSGEAALQAAEASLEQARQAVETARVQLNSAQQNLKRQQDLWKQQLTTREALEQAENDVQDRAVGPARSARSRCARRKSRLGQERAQLESARYDLSKVRIESPIDGIVTRRNIQEGETAVVGTMNNAGTVLLTLADMSVIQAEVEVDETNIPNVHARTAGEDHDRRDARSHVQGPRHRDRQQPDSGDRSGRDADQQATNFKVVVVLDEEVPDVRPGFTCTADITTATRKNVVAVPIPAVAVRELVYDAKGQIVKQPRTDERSGARSSRPPRRRSSSPDRRARRPKACSSSATAARSSCRSRSASPATGTSRCCRA